MLTTSKVSATASIAIIGGGLAGTLAAIQVLRTSQSPVHVQIYEPGPHIGRGLAYAAPDAFHTLNGPAKNFSLRAEDPGHFVAWLQTRDDDTLRAQAGPAAHWFAPRRLFGDYVNEEFQAALALNSRRATFEHVREKVVDLEVDTVTGEVTLKTQSGQVALADHVVLALGIFGDRSSIHRHCAVVNQPWYLPTPWDRDRLHGLADKQDLLLIGSGLTMIDTVIALENAGFRGRYHVVSRRGLTPQAWRDAPAVPDFLDLSARHFTVRSLLRSVRVQAAALHAAGDDWQRLVLAVRPHLSVLWSRTNIAERRRFMRHVRPYWDLFLHRAPPPGRAVLDAVRATGRLVSRAASIEGFSANRDDSVTARYRPRGQLAVLSLKADAVVNCVGFEYRWDRVEDPLVRSLLRRGLVQPSAIGLGIEAHPQSFAAIDSDGTASASISAVGLPLRGALFESGTIGELLKQSLILAPRLNFLVEQTTMRAAPSKSAPLQTPAHASGQNAQADAPGQLA